MRTFAFPVAVLAAFSAVSCFAQVNVAIGNYSGYKVGQPLAVGSIASAYAAFTGITATSAQTLSPMPTELGTVRVRVGGTDAPLYFVGPTQINFVVPVGLSTGQQQVEVLVGGNVFGRGTVNVYTIGPALAISGDPAVQQGIIQNQNNAVNGQNARAARGEVIQLYATGCGPTNPASVDGQPPAALSRATAMVRAFISYEEAQVQFAGAHPQFPGICQVNLTIPNSAPLTGQLPVFVSVSGVPSNAVTVWVQ